LRSTGLVNIFGNILSHYEVLLYVTMATTDTDFQKHCLCSQSIFHQSVTYCQHEYEYKIQHDL